LKDSTKNERRDNLAEVEILNWQKHPLFTPKIYFTALNYLFSHFL